jgi:hypothetical protein
MRKTTVYLPERLKSKLARAAVESGRSEEISSARGSSW